MWGPPRYRAKFIVGTVRELSLKPEGGEAWLAALRNAPLEVAIQSLTTLPGKRWHPLGLATMVPTSYLGEPRGAAGDGLDLGLLVAGTQGLA